jgi:hypothetical protein
VVIDLSRQPQDEKIEYIRGLLPALNEIRRRTGLPHRILVDEAHYFLHDADARELLDLKRNGYTFVTYWASRLPRDLLAATEVMIVTRESSPVEIEALQRWCAACEHVDASRWAALARLPTAEAVALPLTEEAGGQLVTFTLGPRLTPHVRHREKYVDVPIPENRAFVFGHNGHRSPRRVRTLRQFVSMLDQAPGDVEGYVRRGDFSRWIREVFGDYALATQLRGLEEKHCVSPSGDTLPEIVNAIRARYDLTDEDQRAGEL